MPIKNCNENGKPGKKYGDRDKCYTYTPGNKQSKHALLLYNLLLNEAIKKIEGPTKFAKIQKSEGSIDQNIIKDIINDSESTIEEAEAMLNLLTGNPLDIIVAADYVNNRKNARK